MSRLRRREACENGQTLVWFITVVVLVAMVLALVVRSGGAVASHARAQSVADLSALAAVTGGDDAALRSAAANGASVIGIRREGDAVTVAVRWRGLAASATAEPADEPRTGREGSAVIGGASGPGSPR